MAVTLLKYPRKEFYQAEIKDIIEQLDEWTCLHEPNEAEQPNS
jgi:hypothetical protein